MRTREDQYLALDCLRLACGHPNAPDPVSTAEKFYAFVRGSNDAETLAKIREALAT